AGGGGRAAGGSPRAPRSRFPVPRPLCPGPLAAWPPRRLRSVATPMALVLLRRLVWMVPILLGVSLVVFSMMHLAPGDPAEALMGPLSTKETLAKARRDLGLDRPLYVQYGDWVFHAAQGDLGQSVRLSQPVAPEVWARAKHSALLAAVAFVVSVLVGVTIGTISAARRGGVLDNALMAVTVT